MGEGEEGAGDGGLRGEACKIAMARDPGGKLSSIAGHAKLLV